MSEADCGAARGAIERCAFVGWRGLPTGCPADALLPGLPAGPAGEWPVRHLGADLRPATFALLDLDAYYRPMASFDGPRLVLVDGMNPELAGGLAPLLADLGDPAERLDWFYGTLAIPRGEWVFPERGITLFLNTDADDALHIALYRPASAAEYLRVLRPNLRKTRERRKT